jgi:hypothetical protein
MHGSEEVKPIMLAGFDKDPELVKSGAPVDLGRNPDGSPRVILVRPLNSAAYEDLVAAQLKGYSRITLQNDPEITRRAQKVAFCKVVFVGGANLFAADAFEPTPTENDGVAWKRREDAVDHAQSFEGRRGLIEDRDFYIQALEASAAMETFRKARIEGDLGNSKPASPGN